MKFDDSAYRVAAMKKYETAGSYKDELIEVDRCTVHDHNTLVVPANDRAGAWVKAWIFISDDEAAKEA